MMMRYMARKRPPVSRRLACRFFGHGSQKLIYRRSTSPGAKISTILLTSKCSRRTFAASLAASFFAAWYSTSLWASMPTKSVAGSRQAISLINAPLPVPSSTWSGPTRPNSSRHRPPGRGATIIPAYLLSASSIPGFRRKRTVTPPSSLIRARKTTALHP